MSTYQETLDAVLAALAGADDAGMSSREVAGFLLGSPSRRYQDAGRCLKVLIDVGLVEAAETRGRFRVTAAGRHQADPDALGRQSEVDLTVPTPPLLPKLPDVDEGSTPPTSGDIRAARSSERVRALNEAVARIKDDDGEWAAPEALTELHRSLAVHGLDDWEVWLPAMFPRLFTAPFGAHHAEFWNWLWRIESGRDQEPFVGVWNRGGAKSASAEAGLVALAARERRKYALYVSGTQMLADEHVANIGSLLESPELASVYPTLSERMVGKYGESKGWRRNRLRTTAGFTVDALGLDTASRGLRIDEARPDVIVLDDVDSENDTPAAVERKIRTITRKLLPAGSQDCVVIAIQNVIHGNSIFARLANLPGAPRIDFLARRLVSGPVPAVWDMEWAQDGDSFRIVSGEASWEGMPLESCQAMMDRFGLTSFLVECQHEEANVAGGMFDHLDFGSMRVTRAEVPVLRQVTCWVDPAVTSTDRSDSCGVVVDGLGSDRRYYRLWSWERIASPVEALKVAISAAIEFGAQVVGVETDQGGDTWRTVYQSALQELMDEGLVVEGARVPRFESAKAGATQLSKVERANRMLADYELGRFRHVEGGCGPLEAGLRRFPAVKPFDCVDAAYWSWRWLADQGGERQVGFRARAPRGQAAEVSASNLL